MTRATPILLLAAFATGCASSKPEPEATYTYPGEPFSFPASALVFDPPVAADLPPLDLSREPRQAMAFGGFEQSAETYSYVRTDDRQSTAYLDSYDRRTISIQLRSSNR